MATKSPRQHHRSQSWHNFTDIPNNFNRLVGTSSKPPILPVREEDGQRRPSRSLMERPKSRRWRTFVDLLIVGAFMIIVLSFWQKDGVAWRRRVCPKIQHGINSSFELYHERKGPKIVISSGAYSNVVDGVSRTLNRLVSDLQSRGYRVLVLAPVVDPPAMPHHGMLLPVPSFSLPFRAEYSFARGIDSCTREVLQGHDPDFVHIATPDYLGMQVQKWAQEHTLPIGCSYHTRFNSYLPYYFEGAVLHTVNSALWQWLQYFYDGCDHVYPPTRRIGKEITDHGVTSEMRIWPRGIDLSSFNPNYRSEEQRKEWGVKPGEVVVLLASRMVWEKNVRVYIDTMNYLLEKKVPVRPVVVGAGPALASIRTEMPEAYFMGHLGGSNLSTAFASSDIFFFPSLTETWGNVALEAMASGTTVVLAKGPGGTELVRHNDTGYLVDVTDPEDPVRAIKELVENRQLRHRLAITALQVIRSEQAYSWSHVTDILEQHYVDLMEQGKMMRAEGSGERSAHRQTRPMPPEMPQTMPLDLSELDS
eukprot:m.19220 g.19220  ORF g.19220 m.19220 type:complete len:533 (+) comp6513_c0_seq1:219-1817(+)